MEDRLLPDRITREDFDEVLSRYPSTVPEKIRALDQARLQDIPAALKKRTSAATTGPSLTREEALKLVDWKLTDNTSSHGTFRPRLKALVESNADLSDATGEGLAIAAAKPSDAAKVKAALTKLTTSLKGVGPATASLFLSTAAPDEIPFFGDEVFRWVNFGNGKGEGWDRPIKYNAKEYELLLAGVAAIRDRLHVRAVDVECVGYVLDREAAGLGGVASGSGSKGVGGGKAVGGKADGGTTKGKVPDGANGEKGREAKGQNAATLGSARAKVVTGKRTGLAGGDVVPASAEQGLRRSKRARTKE